MSLTEYEKYLAQEEARYTKIKQDFEWDRAHPLVTAYTRFITIPNNTLDKLARIRHHNTDEGPIPVDLGHLWRSEFTVKAYQTQAVAHLALMPRFILGDAVGLGKTVMTIASICYLKKRYPDLKIVIMCTKSVQSQWVEEIEKFSKLRAQALPEKWVGETGFPARARFLEDFLDSKLDLDVVVGKYSSLIGVRREIPGEFDENGDPRPSSGKELVSKEIKLISKIMRPHRDNILLVTDEAQKFASPDVSVRKLINRMAARSSRVWALSATTIKNDLAEFYNIALAIGIAPLGDLFEFTENHCIRSLQKISRTRRAWKTTGYRNLEVFKRELRPFFLGRSQSQVKEKLPRLQTKFYNLDPSPEQTKLLLHDLPNGNVVLPASVKKINGEIQIKDRDFDNMMTKLGVYQAVANHWGLIDVDDKKKYLTSKLSPKEEMLLDLLDGELAGEKVVFFTKSLRWIDRLEALTKAGKFTERKILRITGNESEKVRAQNRRLFQDPNSGYDLIMINTAGVEGINLQQAGHMIAGDLPWSYGQTLQLIGRIMRMASPHSACTLHVLVLKGTIDEYTIDTLRAKKGVFEAILGRSHSAGLLDAGENIEMDIESGMEKLDEKASDFAHLLKANLKKTPMNKFLSGAFLTTEGHESLVKGRTITSMSVEDLMDKWDRAAADETI